MSRIKKQKLQRDPHRILAFVRDRAAGEEVGY